MDADKPVSTRNFIRYVKTGAYQDLFFHRCVPNFIVQGGGFYTKNRFTANPPPVIAGVTNYGPITNEYQVGRLVSNTYGTIAMAKLGGNPDSASSQWFFNLNNNAANLDNQNGGFTVFGTVRRGTNVLNRFNTILPDLRIANRGGALSELPVLNPGADPVGFQHLVYVDVSLLNVQVQLLPAGVLEISWNSVTNLPHHVEFTAMLPPVWKSLISTNGTGGPMRVQDANLAEQRRFYRVRVEY